LWGIHGNSSTLSLLVAEVVKDAVVLLNAETMAAVDVLGGPGLWQPHRWATFLQKATVTPFPLLAEPKIETVTSFSLPAPLKIETVPSFLLHAQKNN
jgi:hypothetical protein